MKIHVDNVQMRQTDESQWMMSQMSCTKQLHKSHKSITQWTIRLDAPEQLRFV